MGSRSLWRGGLAAGVLALAGCDQLGLGPPPSEASAPPPAPAPLPDFAASVGQSYASFAAEAGARYAPEALGLNAIDRARLWRAMADAQPGVLVQGGGAEALVFRGCAETGCAAGLAVVAVDTASGDVFVGVRDAGGAVELTPNDRLEALLRLNSESRRWDDVPDAAATAL
jgi:hypothetical protein